MPQGVTLTDVEGSEHSGLKTTIDTYVNENAGLFISGQKSFDEWDAFIAQIKELGADRAVEIEQAALDRYYARGK
jgi:putative aldouronate transport system substrate-binding protein